MKIVQVFKYFGLIFSLLAVFLVIIKGPNRAKEAEILFMNDICLNLAFAAVSFLGAIAFKEK